MGERTTKLKCDAQYHTKYKKQYDSKADFYEDADGCPDPEEVGLE
ncbi:hypothetical protein NP511_17950 [Natrinema thermotolerans]|uniref:Uncharacterized protein n=1 Tax=Natrinema thermotolerans TaxID=121872 RepID=A0AAF0PB36_9EURY|nr:hypothetical protein [Natrinema thermotolerans]WMT07259.1 hypothetical protein NP511_17950 [Natrinema thermotolerans]